MDKVAAYLDLLGFSEAVKQDLNDAVGMLSGYQTIVSQMVSATQSHGATHLQQFGIGSVDSLMPFSDSIFMTSKDPDLFVKQLSRFLLDSFQMHADLYANPENPTDPIEVTEYLIKPGTAQPTPILARWRPILFTGGISFGDVVDLGMNSIVTGQANLHTIVAGIAIVRAVGLEKKRGKGPTIQCDDQFVAQLQASVIKKYIQHLPSKRIYRLFWTNALYNEQDEFSHFQQEFDQLFLAACNLWKAYKSETYGEYYAELMIQLINGTKHYFDGQPCQQHVDQHLLKQMQNIGIPPGLGGMIW